MKDELKRKSTVVNYAAPHKPGFAWHLNYLQAVKGFLPFIHVNVSSYFENPRSEDWSEMKGWDSFI